MGEEERGWPRVCTLWGMLELVSPRLCSGRRKWLPSRYPKADLQSPALCPENWGFSFCTCPQVSFILYSQSLPLQEPLAMTSDLTTPRTESS